MVANLNFLTNALFAVVCIIMGISFLSLPVPNKEGLNNYRISLRVLAATYIILALLTILVMMFNFADNSREYFTFITIFIASSQAMLFTLTLITLINPNFSKIKNIVYHTLPLVVFLGLYTLSFFLNGDPVLLSIQHIGYYINNPTIWIRLAFLFYFLFQLIYYTNLFLREAKKYNKELLDFFSEVYLLKLKWVYIAFFLALAIGIMVLISSMFPTSHDWITTIVFTIFYFAFAQEYIKYNKSFTIIEPAIAVVPANSQSQVQAQRIRAEWSTYKKQIVAERYYCEPGITIIDLAQKLQIGRTTLSNFINREEAVNFNTWINKLRVEEAKKLLRNKPECSLVDISEMVGFTEQSNFSRQFKQVTGKTPLVWRKTQMLA